MAGEMTTGGRPVLCQTARARIGARLRSMYIKAAKEPLPTELVELLLALRRKEREREAHGACAD